MLTSLEVAELYLDHPVRLLLVEESRFLSHAISVWFRGMGISEEIALVHSYSTLKTSILEHQPELIILPAQLDRLSGSAVVEEIRKLVAASRIVFLLGNPSDTVLREILSQRPAGLLGHDALPEQIATALQSILEGHQGITPDLLARISVLCQSPANNRAGNSGLTRRQHEVLRYLAMGYTVKEVAKLMHLSVKSIDSHKYRIMKKLDMHDRVHLTRYAIREGLLEA